MSQNILKTTQNLSSKAVFRLELVGAQPLGIDRQASNIREADAPVETLVLRMISLIFQPKQSLDSSSIHLRFHSISPLPSPVLLDLLPCRRLEGVGIDLLARSRRFEAQAVRLLVFSSLARPIQAYAAYIHHLETHRTTT